MKINLCEVFGVEEGEEFRIKTSLNKNTRYRIDKGFLEHQYNGLWKMADVKVNAINGIEIIKLPKKKQFTDDELCILRNIDKEYKWIAREDRTENILLFGEKPLKNDNKIWVCKEGVCTFFRAFDYIFKCIQWEDEEPVCIDDYVKR